MNGSEFLETIRALPRLPDREDRIFDAVINGDYLAWPTTRVDAVDVANDYFAIGTPDDFVRIPCSLPLARRICAELGARLPTVAEVDAIWRAAPVKLAPLPWGPPYDATMLSVERLGAHTLKIESQRAGRRGLIAGHKKDVVEDPTIARHPGKVAIYGWHTLGGQPLQPLFPSLWSSSSTGHEESYADYAHGLRLVWDVAATDPPPTEPTGGATADSPEAMAFVQARHFTVGPRSSAIDLVVIHDMEAADGASTAEHVAAWFAGASAPQASAHYCVDVDSIVQCVREEDIAWHAPGANHNGIGIELAGFARSSSEAWEREEGTLARAARLAACICRRRGLPIAFVDVAELVAGGARGITTHAAVSRAFKKSTHTDPGTGFPMARFLEMARS